VSRYQKDKTDLDFTEARDSEWQWHQLGYMQVCTSLQTDNHASTLPLSFLQAGCPSNQQRQSTRHKIGHFKDVSPSQSLGLVWKKLNLTQEKHAFTRQKKRTTTQNKHKN